MNYLFTVAIVIISTVNMVNCGFQVYSAQCVNIGSGGDSTEYDTQTQLCCNGQIYQKNPNFYQDCCGEAGPFAIETHTCCGNEILPRDSELKCCNHQQTYNDSTHICCGSDIHRNQEDNLVCCGQDPMNRHEQTCCQTGPRTYARLDGHGYCCGADKVYMPHTQLCCHTGFLPQMSSAVHDVPRSQRHGIECCGLKTYITSTEICCNGVVHDKDDHTSCCGDQAYNILDQVCCNGIVSDIVDGKTECCGKTSFNPTIEQCCLFKVSSLANGKCCGNQAYHPSDSSCCNERINDGIPEIEGVQKCCRGLSYLETQQICCNGELCDQQKDMNCCGKNMYNTTTHLCCAQDSIVDRKTSATRCCGSGGFESNSETCCEAANRGFAGLGRRCCHQSEGVDAYNPTQDVCCSWRGYERLYPGIPTSDAQCCRQYLVLSNQLCDGYYGIVNKTHPDDDKVCRPRGSRNYITYNSNNQVCTRLGTVMLKGQEQQICGGSLYDTDTHICCQGMVHSKYDKLTGNTKVCCQPGIQAYMIESQTCCAGRVADIHPSVAGCCRNNPYDTRTDTCDQNGLIRPTEEVQRHPNMCGYQPYHPDEHSCCGGDVLIGWGETCCFGYKFNTSTDGINAGGCCGYIGYNPDTQICCGENLAYKASPGKMMKKFLSKLFKLMRIKFLDFLLHISFSAVTCCGHVLWDPTTSEDICCKGSLQPIQSPYGDRLNCSGQMAYNKHRETVCDGVRYQQRHGHCCGKKLFDPMEEICCSEQVYPKSSPDTRCCGSLPYIPSDTSTICCEGSTLHYDAQGKQCCGNQAIDIHQKQCCTVGDIPYAYKTNQNTCCSSNNAQDTCCHGNLHLNIKDGDCCGSAVIRHPDLEMCCDGAKFSKEYGTHSMCCGKGVIDSRVYTCCNGRRIRKQLQGCCNNQVFSKNRGACCGSEIYSFSNSQICCNNTLHDSNLYGCCNQNAYTKGKYGCCSREIFDPANQVCQEGKIGTRERRQTTLAESPLCNGISYNEAKEGCCGTTLYGKTELRCCNGQIYNPQSAVCCGNEISFKRNGACCGETNRAYNSHKTICCNGVIRRRFDVGTTECCGMKNYQNVTQMCCDGKVHDRYDGVSNLECCGNQAFSPEVEICCKNSVVDTTSSYVKPSCYTKLYDAVSGAVSDATVWVQKMIGPNKRKAYKRKQYFHPSGECCGRTTWVDRLTHTCCRGIAVEGRGECCGSRQVFDPKIQLCCPDTNVVALDIRTVELGQQNHYGCCGSQSYNRLEQECCDGVPFERIPYHECFGSSYIDTRSRTHFYCEYTGENILIVNGKTECCRTMPYYLNQATPYNPNQETCFRGKVYPIANGDTCSTQGVFSPTSSSCCNTPPRTYSISHDTPSLPLIQDCCGLQSYLKSDQMCCNDQFLYNRTPGIVERCCGTSDPINTATHLCCEETPTPKPNANHACCGSTTYDTLHQTCCNGRVFDIPNGECCLAGAFDATQSTCCEGNIWPSTERKGVIHNGTNQSYRCCGEQLLDDNQLCMKGETHVYYHY
ncbi:uncharacterized protein [Amphiura filiformis]|uniref:uncharacterized protein n=1 Tax=Amphiura filiformis TaxID=82378 RepID=UPI003B21A481